MICEVYTVSFIDYVTSDYENDTLISLVNRYYTKVRVANMSRE